jgi:phage-related protein
MKILNWIILFLPSVFGILQAVIKLVKEILTAIVNCLYPVIPSKKFQGVVDAIRGVVNTVDDWVEKIKNSILGVIK